MYDTFVPFLTNYEGLKKCDKLYAVVNAILKYILLRKKSSGISIG